MPVHLPKYITSQQGLGLNTTKELHAISETLAVGTEFWGEVERPWQESGTVIADNGFTWRTRWEVGRPYIITTFLDPSNTIVGIYCDISTPVRKNEGGFEFEDMYLDVWIVHGEAPRILDEDELDEALSAALVTQNQYDETKRAANELVALYQQKSIIFEF